MNCACPEAMDARSCFELRHYGHSPSLQNEYNESCECVCHSWDEDDDEREAYA